MSSHESGETVERMGSATKRISTLNDHEGHLLRRRINAYQKIHNKEIAGVTSQLEEIRESMKALVTDPLYGTHALNNTGVGQGSSSRTPVANRGQKTMLRRTQSFPELSDGSSDGGIGVNSKSFPAVKSEHHSAARHVKYGERTAAVKSRSRTIGSHHVNSPQFKNDASGDWAWEVQGHKRLERSKTAPVAMLQPLLKTTPEMMRKKIHISTSNRLNTEECSTRRDVSPRYGDSSSITRPSQLTQADLENRVHRPKTTFDSQLMVKQTSHSVHESSLQCKPGVNDIPNKRVPARAEQTDVAFVSLQTVKSHGRKSSSKGISKPFHQFKEDLFKANEVNDKETEDMEDLRNYRYLRFAKESQESNRI